MHIDQEAKKAYRILGYRKYKENKNSIIYQPITKSFVIKLYKKGFKIHELATALGLSNRTIWKTIIKYRNGKKITRKNWNRRFPKYWRLKSVKIKRIKTIQKLFLNLLDWLQNAKILDLDAITEGKPV